MDRTIIDRFQQDSSPLHTFLYLFLLETSPDLIPIFDIPHCGLPELVSPTELKAYLKQLHFTEKLQLSRPIPLEEAPRQIWAQVLWKMSKTDKNISWTRCGWKDDDRTLLMTLSVWDIDQFLYILLRVLHQLFNQQPPRIKNWKSYLLSQLIPQSSDPIQKLLMTIMNQTVQKDAPLPYLIQDEKESRNVIGIQTYSSWFTVYADQDQVEIGQGPLGTYLVRSSCSISLKGECYPDYWDLMGPQAVCNRIEQLPISTMFEWRTTICAYAQILTLI